MPRYARGFDVDAAHAHLMRDRALAAWMRRLGRVEPESGWRKRLDPVDALARAILYQQLSGKAAATIVARVEAAIGSTRLHHATLAQVDDVTLRECGVSGNKILALRDLIAHEAEAEIPTPSQMSVMAPEAIIAALVPIRGIGRWTVEMMLMFRLGRADILPVDDLGIRKGAQRLDRLAALPAASALSARGARWGPYRTYASLYLWRIADFADGKVAATKRSQD